jgi:ElaB/YqjD/DUF883 family membrane-anchored ribosome-binding protein
MGDSPNTGTSNLTDKAAEVGQNLRDLGGQVRDQAREKYQQFSEQAQDYYGQGREMAQQWEQGLESHIQEKPLQSLLIAAGIGMLLGILWKRS